MRFFCNKRRNLGYKLCFFTYFNNLFSSIILPLLWLIITSITIISCCRFSQHHFTNWRYAGNFDTLQLFQIPSRPNTFLFNNKSFAIEYKCPFYDNLFLWKPEHNNKLCYRFPLEAQLSFFSFCIYLFKRYLIVFHFYIFIYIEQKCKTIILAKLYFFIMSLKYCTLSNKSAQLQI